MQYAWIDKSRWNACIYSVLHFDPLPAKHDYSRFWSVLLADQISDIGNAIRFLTSQ